MPRRRTGVCLAASVFSLFLVSASSFSLGNWNTFSGRQQQQKDACVPEMSSRRIAVVTGANKGIGFEIARILGAQPNTHCILACRNPELGQRAAAELQRTGGDVSFKPLDISDPRSIEMFASMIKQEYGAIDMLVNNAGFAFKGADPTPFTHQARPTLSINYFGTVNVCEYLKPLIRDNGRVSIVSSMSGRVSIFPPQVRERLLSPALTTAEISQFANLFIQDVEAGTHQQKGWPNTTYGASKGFVSAYTRVLARELKGRNILVNCCCPGYCVTDMSSRRGNRSAAEGAKTPAMLAMLPAGAPTGEYWTDGVVRNWAQT